MIRIVINQLNITVYDSLIDDNESHIIAKFKDNLNKAIEYMIYENNGCYCISEVRNTIPLFKSPISQTIVIDNS